VLAQEKGDDGGLGGPAGDREITEDMARACPELKTAVGRRKAQFLALYFDLPGKSAGDAQTKKTVADAFDLGNAEDSAFLEKLLLERGPYKAQDGVRLVVACSGPKGVAWVLERFEKIKPEGKGRLIDALLHSSEREVWKFLQKLLDDQTPVPNWRASQEAPPGYVDLRVCDHALRTLGSRLIAAEIKLPEDAKGGQVTSLMPIDDRQTRIALVKSALLADKAYADLVAKAPSVLEGLDAKQKPETAERLKRLGVE
jgi:hypothetical protein